MVSDSMLRCLNRFSWSSPFSVQLLCSGGQPLMDTVCQMYDMDSRINNFSSGGGELSFNDALSKIR
jgi:hypothetical protein